MIPQPKEKPNKHALSSDFIELTPASTYGDTLAVGGKHQQTAKFWDSIPSKAATPPKRMAVFLRLYNAHNRLMPSVRGIRGANRNKRVVTLGSDRDTRQILPNSKTCQGVVAMTAIKPMGNPARRAPAHLAIGGAV